MGERWGQNTSTGEKRGQLFQATAEIAFQITLSWKKEVTCKEEEILILS